MPALSVTIITKNEAANIAAAVQSAAWADEIVVVDCGSTDATVQIARSMNARVVHHPWQGYAEQKNVAADAAAHEWILSLDADERITPPLAQEIRTLLATEPAHAGYRIPRVSWYLGRWIRTTDWYPDPQLRLYDRRRARWRLRRVHESVTVEGTTGRVQHEIEHRPYRDLAHHLETMNRYTSLAAADMFDAGRRARVVSLVAQPAAAFLRNYVARRGFLQGSAGLVVSALNSYYVFLKFAKLRELQTRDPRTRDLRTRDPQTQDPRTRHPEAETPDPE